MTTKNNFQHLLGKHKKEMINMLGEEFNFYPWNIWTYYLKRTWLGQRKILVIVFKEDIAVKTYIKKTYGKIDTDKL